MATLAYVSLNLLEAVCVSGVSQFFLQEVILALAKLAHQSRQNARKQLFVVIFTCTKKRVLVYTFCVLSDVSALTARQRCVTKLKSVSLWRRRHRVCGAFLCASKSRSNEARTRLVSLLDRSSLKGIRVRLIVYMLYQFPQYCLFCTDINFL